MKIKSILSFGAIVAVASMAISALVGMTSITAANAADKVKVGFVYLTTPGDHGWTYAHEIGRQQVEKHFGDKVEQPLLRMYQKAQTRRASSAN